MAIPCEEHRWNVLPDFEKGVFVVILVFLISNWSLNHDIPAPILPFAFQELHTLFVVITLLEILIPSRTFERTEGSVGLPLDNINWELIVSPKQIARLDWSR